MTFTPPPLFCFGFIYLLCIYCTFFPFLFHTLIMYMFSCVLLSHLLEFLLSRNVSLQSCSNYHTPPSCQPLVSTLLAGTTLMKTYHRPQPSLYKHRVAWLEPAFCLDSWPLKMGQRVCPETSVRNYDYSQRNDQKSAALNIYCILDGNVFLFYCVIVVIMHVFM
jgi:hypothetical protein